MTDTITMPSSSIPRTRSTSGPGTCAPALHVAAELPLDDWFPDHELCEPHITQDGYDDGQLFVCTAHGVSEPVLGENGHQTYEVTLPMFQRLVTEHWRQVADS